MFHDALETSKIKQQQPRTHEIVIPGRKVGIGLICSAVDCKRFSGSYVAGWRQLCFRFNEFAARNSPNVICCWEIRAGRIGRQLKMTFQTRSHRQFLIKSPAIILRRQAGPFINFADEAGQFKKKMTERWRREMRSGPETRERGCC